MSSLEGNEGEGLPVPPNPSQGRGEAGSIRKRRRRSFGHGRTLRGKNKKATPHVSAPGTAIQGASASEPSPTKTKPSTAARSLLTRDEQESKRPPPDIANWTIQQCRRRIRDDHALKVKLYSRLVAAGRELVQLKHTMKEERTELEENLDVAIEVQEHVMGQKVKAVKGELTVVKTKLTKMEGKMNAQEDSVQLRENDIADREEKLEARQRALDDWKRGAASRLREEKIIVNEVSFFLLPSCSP